MYADIHEYSVSLYYTHTYITVTNTTTSNDESLRMTSYTLT